jgi:hypothetical protein
MHKGILLAVLTPKRLRGASAFPNGVMLLKSWAMPPESVPSDSSFARERVLFETDA